MNEEEKLIKWVAEEHNLKKKIKRREKWQGLKKHVQIYIYISKLINLKLRWKSVNGVYKLQYEWRKWWCFCAYEKSAKKKKMERDKQKIKCRENIRD